MAQEGEKWRSSDSKADKGKRQLLAEVSGSKRDQQRETRVCWSFITPLTMHNSELSLIWVVSCVWSPFPPARLAAVSPPPGGLSFLLGRLFLLSGLVEGVLSTQEARIGGKCILPKASSHVQAGIHLGRASVGLMGNSALCLSQACWLTQCLSACPSINYTADIYTSMRLLA